MTSDLLSAISIVVRQSNLTFISIFSRSRFRPKSVNSCPWVLRIILAWTGDLHRPEESPPHPGKILINKAQWPQVYSTSAAAYSPGPTLGGLPVLPLSSDFYFPASRVATPEPL